MDRYLRGLLVVAAMASSIAFNPLAAAETGARAATVVKSEWTPEWNISQDFLSKYVGASSGSESWPHPVSQTNINAKFGTSCLSANVWISKYPGSAGPINNPANEIDWTLACGWSDGDFGYVVSATYFDLSTPKLFDMKGDAVQFVAEVNYTFDLGEFGKVAPYLHAEPSVVVDGSARNGAYLHAGVRHRLPLLERVTFVESGRILYDTGFYGNASGYNLRYDAALVVKLSDQFDLRAPYIRYFVPMTDFHDGRKDELVIGAGLDWHPL